MVAQVILFENVGYGGDHLHVVAATENLGTIPGHGFDNKTSAIAVIEGYWQFFKDYEWQNPFPNILGPGAYYWVEDALGSGSNNSITGLRPVELAAAKWVPVAR